LRWAVAAGLAGIALAVALALATRPEAPATPPATERPRGLDRIALLPFTVSEDSLDLELVSLSLTDLLWARLNALPGVLARSPDYAAEDSREAASLAEVARNAQVGHLLSGRARLAPGARRALVEVELYGLDDAGRLTTLPIGRYEMPLLGQGTDMAAFTRTREAIVRNVLAHLGPTLAEPSRQDFDPSDPEAFRLYLLARRRLTTVTCGEGLAVVELLDRSLELDPGFTHAWLAKAFALYNQGWACGGDASWARAARAAIDHALEIRPGYPPAVHLQSHLLTEDGKAEEAFELVRAARRENPAEPALLFAEAYVLRFAGYLAPAERALAQLLELDPLFLHEYGEVPTTLLYLGRWDEFLDRLPATEAPYYLYYRGLAEMLRGREEAARHALEPAFRLNPNDVFARLSAALVAVLDDDPRTAAEITRGLARQRQAVGTPDGEITYKQAQVLALAGARGDALEQLALAVEQGFFCAPCLAGDPMLRPLAGDPRFAATLAAAEERHRAFGRRFGFAVADRGPSRNPQAPIKTP
jgi:tetratricopeptide (TPR) repeat protein